MLKLVYSFYANNIVIKFEFFLMKYEITLPRSKIDLFGFGDEAFVQKHLDEMEELLALMVAMQPLAVHVQENPLKRRVGLHFLHVGI